VLGLGSSAVIGLYSDSQSQTNSSLAIPSPTGSIHQASLSQLGVYSDSDNEANSNPPNPLPTESIHQALSHVKTQLLLVHALLPRFINQMN